MSAKPSSPPSSPRRAPFSSRPMTTPT
ncbi:serine racemase [Histoplasma capsulatum G186AR]|uniref:Serine racemase n=1 Tax=Ajellomyces capsulatus TaxID=5037 RepID=A0A8H7YI29_AJECA|nr:serine racemase [Histoplasma capsulatum]QSS72260.1 serine racemase [Histoplasma capsulatum G186AR]